MRKWKGTQVWSGQWGVFKNPHYIGCCDCGLVHKIYFRIGRKGYLEYKVFREPDLTRSARKQKKYKKQ